MNYICNSSLTIFYFGLDHSRFLMVWPRKQTFNVALIGMWFFSKLTIKVAIQDLEKVGQPPRIGPRYHWVPHRCTKNCNVYTQDGPWFGGRTCFLLCVVLSLIVINLTLVLTLIQMVGFCCGGGGCWGGGGGPLFFLPHSRKGPDIKCFNLG